MIDPRLLKRYTKGGLMRSGRESPGNTLFSFSEPHKKGSIMEYATLGNTGLLVSKLCFGTMTFGDGRGLFKAISTVGQSAADELVSTSIDGGINFFDTADNYTEGERS